MKKLAMILAMLVAGLTWEALASGSYRFIPPRPPVDNVPQLDEKLYAEGRNLFTGRTKPSGQAIPGLIRSQEARLRFLRSKLPRSIRERVDLSRFAKQLSPSEMAAMEYYLVSRYKVDLYGE
ncbi:MAG: hypothetical protein AAGH72_06170 [Verrucomicrobiota bacterium]